MRILLKCIAGAILASLTLGIALEHGAWQRTETHAGPFRREDATTTALVPIGVGLPMPFLLHAGSDFPGELTRSDLRLWVNGEEWGPPHMLHAQIRRGDTHGFSHYNDHLRFSLVDAANNSGTKITVQYSVRFAPAILIGLILTSVVLITPVLVRAGRSKRLVPWLQPLAQIPRAYLFLAYAIVAACVAYAASIAIGHVRGDALTNTTIFRLLPPALRLAEASPFLPHLVLTLAAAGASVSWCASLGLIPRLVVRRGELRLLRFWGFAGLAVILCVFVFLLASGGWRGVIEPLDLNFMSVIGLVPQSDAAAYFAGAFDQAFVGRWFQPSSWRPMAAAFRQVTVLAAQFSYLATLAFQAALLGLALFLAARALALWRGLWVALAFVGLMILIIRPMLATTMTEPIALVWSLLGVVFLVEALRLGSLPHALLTVAALTAALLTRMGALVLIPGLVIWIGLAFGVRRERALSIGLAVVVVAALIAINSLLMLAFGDEYAQIGGNFAHIACQLARGTHWPECAVTFGDQLQMEPNSAAQSRLLYEIAWRSFSENPGVLGRELFANAKAFAEGLPRFFFGGYMRAVDPALSTVLICLVALVPGWFVAFRGTREWRSQTFFVMLFVSLVISAMIVFGDDGWRVFYATHPIVACFVALGFTTPAAVRPAPTRPGLRWQTGAVIVSVLLASFFLAPALSHMQLGPSARQVERAGPAFAEDESRGYDMRVDIGLTGFMVVADNAKLLTEVPSIRLSEFHRLMRMPRFEDLWKIPVHALDERVPFAVVWAPRPIGRQSYLVSIVPPRILLEHAWGWRLNRLFPLFKPGDILLHDEATPIMAPRP